MQNIDEAPELEGSVKSNNQNEDVFKMFDSQSTNRDKRRNTTLGTMSPKIDLLRSNTSNDPDK